jgi:hypothetical protein
MEFLMHSALGASEAMAGPAARRRRRSVAGRWARVSISLCLSFSSLVGNLHSQTQNNLLEYQVKAAFLLNFIKFVEWPATAFPSPDTPITICVVGVDPFGPILDRMVEGESVNSRAVRTRRSVPEANPQGCHVAFVSRYERRGMAQIASHLGSSSVLTVSELPGFTALGGMIEFVMEEEKIGFYINAAMAEAAGLKLSSRLLRAAREVRGSGGIRQ